MRNVRFGRKSRSPRDGAFSDPRRLQQFERRLIFSIYDRRRGLVEGRRRLMIKLISMVEGT
jgi:hypothetical protein